jgi:hypothetical protein
VTACIPVPTNVLKCVHGAVFEFSAEVAADAEVLDRLDLSVTLAQLFERDLDLILAVVRLEGEPDGVKNHD